MTYLYGPIILSHLSYETSYLQREIYLIIMNIFDLLWINSVNVEVILEALCWIISLNSFLFYTSGFATK
jgi:hypothetical protein